jgi:hypothetical protein
MFVELAFAAEDLGDDAFGAEERGEVFLAGLLAVGAAPTALAIRFLRFPSPVGLG